MAVTVKHIFSNPVADGTITSIVRPSDWNSVHALTFAAIEGIGASNTTYTTGSVIFSGQNNITVGSSVNGASQYVRLSVGDYLTTAMASNRGSDFVQATAAFAGTSASGTIASGGISVSVGPYITTAALSNHSHGVSFTSGSVAFQTLSFTNSNGISFNSGTQGIFGSHNAITTARASTDALGLATAGTNITWTANSAGVSINAGGYAGTGFTSTTTAGTQVKATHDTAGLSMAVPAFLTAAGGVQTAISGVIVSDATYTSGTVSFSNQNNITIGSSVNGASQYIRLSVGNYITTARGSTDAIGLNTAGTNITWTANSSGLSINAGGYAGTGFTSTTTAGTEVKATQNTAGLSMAVPAFLTAAGGVQTAISGVVVSDTTYTSGTVSFSNQNNITIGSSVNGATQYIRLSVGNYITTAALSGDTSKYVQNWKLTGNTAGTTSSAQGTDLWFSGGNSITVSGSSNSVVFSVGNYITTADLSANSSNYVRNWKLTGNTAGTTSSAQGTDLWFSGGNSITVSGSSNSVVFSVGNYLTTAMASNRASDFVQATAVFNGTNASGTIASGAISVSVAAPGAAAEANAINLLGANTAGNTTATGSTIGWSGINATLSGTNVSQVVISVPPTSSLVGTSGILISTDGSTISIYQPVASQLYPFNEAPVSNSTLGQSTLYFRPFDLDAMLSASRINFFHSVAFTYSGAPSNDTAWVAAGYGIYTRGTGASTDRISLLTSYSMRYISGSASSSTRLSVTNYWQLSNATSHSTTQYGVNNATAGTYLTSSIGGFRPLAFPVNQLLTAGRYWVGYSVQSASEAGSLVFGHSVLQAHFSNQLAYRPFNVVSAASNASFWDVSNGFGIYSAQSGVWPDTIPLTSDSIRAALVNTSPVFNFSGISQSSNIL